MTNEGQIGARLKQFILILKISQNAFAQDIKVTKGFLNDILNGKKGIGAKLIINTAKAYPQLNIRWLLLGEGEMLEPLQRYHPPSDQVSESATIQYLNKSGPMNALFERLEDIERRLSAIEGK